MRLDVRPCRLRERVSGWEVQLDADFHVNFVEQGKVSLRRGLVGFSEK